MNLDEKKLKKVIVALDQEYPEQAYSLVDEIGEYIDWFKIGPNLFTRSGHEMISFLHRKRKKVFLDMKLLDTPAVVSSTVKQFADLGVHMTTLHCLGGREMLEAAGESCRSTQLQLLGITLLTSQRSADSKEFGFPAKDSELVVKLLNLALETRLSGILCSPHEIADVRPKTVPGFLLVTPGIRIPGEEVFQDDQKRVASPSEAEAWGANYLIVGRPITQAREPREILEKLFPEP